MFEMICTVLAGVGVGLHTGSAWLGVATTTAVYALMPWRYGGGR